ncbi:MAG: hypothetical protein H7838_11860, partial [Magnetococcus sp. DMHC-8]
LAELPDEPAMAQATEEETLAELPDEPAMAEATEEETLAELPDEPAMAQATEEETLAELPDEPAMAQATEEETLAELPDEPAMAEATDEEALAELPDEPAMAEATDEESLAKLLDELDEAEPDMEEEGTLLLDDESTMDEEEGMGSATAETLAASDQEPELLADLLDDLQEELPADAAPDQAEEEGWTTGTDGLEEIDIDGDPELSALEAMETGSDGPMPEDELDHQSATRLLDEEETRMVSAEEETRMEPVLEPESDLDLALEPEPVVDEEAATRVGHEEGEEVTELEVDEEAATRLASHVQHEEEHLEEGDEDALIAVAKESYLPLGNADLLPEDDETWPDEEETRPAAAGKPGKIEPQLDLPAGAGNVAAVVTLAKGSRPAEGHAAPGPARPAAGKAAGRRPVRLAGVTGQAGLAGKWWLAAAVLLVVVAAGLFLRTDWWEYAWFNWRSPYQLSTIDTTWRKHSFGHLLLVQGEVANSGSTPLPPWVQVSLLDSKNNTLQTVQVVPGRVVDKKILEGSGEQAIQAMIHLQGQERTPSESTWTGKRVPFQAIFINPPGEVTRFQVDFSSTSQVSAQQKAQKTGAARL